MNTLPRILRCATLACCGLSFGPSALAQYFTDTGPLNIARQSHIAALLADGRVLVAGGNNGGSTGLASVELYDSASGAWTLTNSMATGRSGAQASLLPDGRVLVAGGIDLFGLNPDYLSSAELFDPSSGTWSAAGSMRNPRVNFALTLLSNGKVLAAGGFDGTNWQSSADIYDPASGSWTAAGSLAVPCSSLTATLLPNGQVLVVGGFNNAQSYTVLPTVTLYDPSAGTWTQTNPLTMGRWGHTATLLANGEVLVVGGSGENSAKLTSATLYDPATGQWSETGGLNIPRYNHRAALLPDGTVLVAGGLGTGNLNLSSAELYDPATGRWTPTSPLKTARWAYALTLLTNGQVLAAGGAPPGHAATASAELFVNRTLSVPVLLTNPIVLPGGAFQFSFASVSNGTYSVLETTDPGLPSSNWTILGNALEASPGEYQFTDFGATNSPSRFYRVLAP